MVKCSKGCTPTCQHCIYAEFEILEYEGETFNGEANKCKLHPEKKISAANWCDDFYCMMTKKL